MFPCFRIQFLSVPFPNYYHATCLQAFITDTLEEFEERDLLVLVNNHVLDLPEHFFQVGKHDMTQFEPAEMVEAFISPFLVSHFVPLYQGA